MTRKKKSQLKIWIRGIVGGAIGGVSSSFIVVVLDPTKFNLTTYGGSARLLAVFAWAAGFGAFTYLRQHPLPDEDEPIVQTSPPLTMPSTCPTCGRPLGV